MAERALKQSQEDLARARDELELRKAAAKSVPDEHDALKVSVEIMPELWRRRWKH